MSPQRARRASSSNNTTTARTRPDVIDEDDLIDVLANYQDVRNALRQSRNARDFYPPTSPGFKGKKGQSKGSSFGPTQPGKGKAKGKQMGKGKGITIQELKLRNRRRACGRIGHWSKECPSNSSRPSSSSASSSSAPTAASAQGTSFYWAGGNAGPAAEFYTESGSESKVSFLTSDHRSADVPFVCVVTSSAEAIVDTAAQDGLIGRPALLLLFEALRKFGLKGRWTGAASEARGVGGVAKTVGVVEVPVGMGQVPGVVALTVVAEDVPFLLPVNLLGERRSRRKSSTPSSD